MKALNPHFSVVDGGQFVDPHSVTCRVVAGVETRWFDSSCVGCRVRAYLAGSGVSVDSAQLRDSRASRPGASRFVLQVEPDLR